MSGKKNKKLRKIVDSAASDIYEVIRAQVNALPLRMRVRFALRILRGRW